MRPSAWAVFALCLLGSTCGTTTTAAEIGFDYVVSTVVLNTVVGSMNKISTVSRQIGAMCANALYFNASVVESATMKVVQAAAVTSGDNGAVLATYAGFVKSQAYYRYRYMQDDAYDGDGRLLASRGNMTVTFGKYVKGMGVLKNEHYMSLGQCKQKGFDDCAVEVACDALGEPVNGAATRTFEYDCTKAHWFQSIISHKERRWTTIYKMDSGDGSGLGVSAAEPLYDYEGKLRGSAGSDIGLGTLGAIMRKALANWYDDAAAAFDYPGLRTYVVDADLRVVAASNALSEDEYLVHGPNSTDAALASAIAAVAPEGVVQGGTLVVDGADFVYVEAIPFATDGLSWYLVTAYDTNCPAGYEVRGLGCEPCQGASDSLAGSPTCDRCVAGYYLRGGSCEDCPANGFCAGGLAEPRPKTGFWGDPRDPHEFYECEPGHCRKDYACRPGYVGRLCARLATADGPDDDRYFTISSSLPFKCPRTGRNRLLLTVLAVLLVVLGWLYVNNVLLSVYAPLGMLVYSVQHMAIIARYQIDFPVKFIQKYSLFLDFMLFDVDVFKPSCVINWTPWRSHVTQMLVCALGLLRFLPVVITASKRLVADRGFRSWAAVKAACSYDGEFGPQIARGVTEFLTLLDVQHTTIAFNCLAAIRCDNINGRWYMREDPKVRCDASNRNRVLYLAFSLVYFIGVVLGLPAYVLHRIRRAYAFENGVHSPEMLDTLGWAYERFRAPLHTWQFNLTMRTVVICVIATQIDNARVQVVLTICLMAMARSNTLKHQPYVKKRLDRFEVFSVDVVFGFLVTTLLLDAHSLGEPLWIGLVVVGQGVFFLVAVFLSFVSYGEDHLREGAIDRVLDSVASAKRGESGAHALFHTLRSAFKKNILERLGTMNRHRRASSTGAALGVQRSFRLQRTTSTKVLRGGKRRSIGVVKHRGNVDMTTDAFCLEAVHEHYLDLSLRMQEMGQTFKQLPFHLWATDRRRDAADFERFAAVAADLKAYVANDSPTSSYSADSRAVFWRKLAQEFPGMIDFCMTELSQVERTVYFGALLRMERYMQRPVRAQALHYLVEDQDRSSVLYYILAADERKVHDLRFCMQSILRSCRLRKRFLVAGRHVMMVPRPVAHAALGISVARASFKKASSGLFAKHTHKDVSGDDPADVYQHCVESESKALRVAFATLGHRAQHATKLAEKTLKTGRARSVSSSDDDPSVGSNGPGDDDTDAPGSLGLDAFDDSDPVDAFVALGERLLARAKANDEALDIENAESPAARQHRKERQDELRRLLGDVAKQARADAAAADDARDPEKRRDAPGEGGFFGSPFADLLFCQAGLNFSADGANGADDNLSCLGPRDPPAWGSSS